MHGRIEDLNSIDIIKLKEIENKFKKIDFSFIVDNHNDSYNGLNSIINIIEKLDEVKKFILNEYDLMTRKSLENINSDFIKIFLIYKWIYQNMIEDKYVFNLFGIPGFFRSNFERNHFSKSQNLEAINYNMGVCISFSLIFFELTKKLKIKSEISTGVAIFEDYQENHAWLKLEIDNKWYNLDYMFDIYNYENNLKPESILIKDSEMKGRKEYYTTNYNLQKNINCNENYNYDEIIKYFNKENLEKNFISSSNEDWKIKKEKLTKLQQQLIKEFKINKVIKESFIKINLYEYLVSEKTIDITNINKYIMLVVNQKLLKLLKNNNKYKKIVKDIIIKNKIKIYWILFELDDTEYFEKGYWEEIYELKNEEEFEYFFEFNIKKNLNIKSIYDFD